MTAYKRNQVEQAISEMHNPGARAPSIALKTRLKRLLETDRDEGRSRQSTDPERAHYAFYSSDAPGSGVEVRFSDYEAFALYLAWRLLEHGWPQSTAVRILRQARPILELKHAEILKRDAAQLFDDNRILRRAGTPVRHTTEPIYLTIASRQGRPLQKEVDRTRSVRVLKEDELMGFLRSEAGLSTTNFELVKSSHDLRRALLSTTPSKRGRGSS